MLSLRTSEVNVFNAPSDKQSSSVLHNWENARCNQFHVHGASLP